MTADYIDILDAAYRIEVDEEQWLTDLGRAVQGAIPNASGVWAMLYDVSVPARARVRRLSFSGASPGFVPGLVTRLLVSADGRRGFGTASCALASEAAISTDVLEHVRTQGLDDALGLNGADPSGAGVFIGVMLGNTGRARAPLSPHTRELGGRLAAHAATAYRLRRRLAQCPDAEDAVLRSDGTIVQANDAASSRASREGLRAAVLALARARGGLRRTAPAAAIAGWRALVAARWTLVDHFAKDGQRYVVARRNEAAASPSLEALTERERQVVAFALLGHANKLIAYELGVATSTVGVLLSRAMAKLGFSSRKEMIAALRSRR